MSKKFLRYWGVRKHDIGYEPIIDKSLLHGLLSFLDLYPFLMLLHVMNPSGRNANKNILQEKIQKTASHKSYAV